jgi:hypothetical protein
MGDPFGFALVSSTPWFLWFLSDNLWGGLGRSAMFGKKLAANDVVFEMRRLG